MNATQFFRRKETQTSKTCATQSCTIFIFRVWTAMVGTWSTFSALDSEHAPWNDRYTVHLLQTNFLCVQHRTSLVSIKEAATNSNSLRYYIGALDLLRIWHRITKEGIRKETNLPHPLCDQL